VILKKNFFVEDVTQAGREYPFMYYLCPYRSRLTDFPYPGHGYSLMDAWHSLIRLVLTTTTTWLMGY